MPMSCLEHDLTALFSASDFGVEDGTVFWAGTPISGGILDDEDVEVPLGEGVAEVVRRLTFTGNANEFVGIRDGDPLIVGDRTFTIKNWSFDGTGVIEIFLEDAS